MKRSKRNTIIISTVLILVGVVLVFIGGSMIGFDFTRLNSVTFEKNNHLIYEDYDSIDISDLECDIIIKYRQNSKDTTLIEATESEGIVNTIEVVDGTLKIRRADNRKWYERFSFWWNDDSALVVYLPDTEYDSISISTASGDIEVPEKFEFGLADIKTVSGDIEYMASTHGRLNIKSTSGDIECIASGDEAVIKTTSGDIYATCLAADDASIESTSGDVKALSFSCKALNVKTTSGEIEFSVFSYGESDSQYADPMIDIRTTSGDIKGVADCDLNYKVDTTSGEVYIPESVNSAPECIIKTTSGDIKVAKRD